MATRWICDRCGVDTAKPREPMRQTVVELETGIQARIRFDLETPNGSQFPDLCAACVTELMERAKESINA